MNKRGVTLITLAVAVTVMAILLMSAIPISFDISNEAKKTKLQSEISQIEVLTSNYIRRNSGNDLEEYVWDLTNIYATNSEQFAGEELTADRLKVYIVDLRKIDAEEVSNGTLKEGENDRYLYSEITGHVYYEKGINIGSKTYYRVPELEE